MVREVRVVGLEAVVLGGELARRIRSADPYAGFWEAGDLQWWWRKPRESDTVEQVFWVDEVGPVAGVFLTAWDGRWQCDAMALPGGPVGLAEVWSRAEEQIAAHVVGGLEVPVRGGDDELRALVEAAGLVAGETDNTAWLDAAARPAVRELPDGYVVVDRTRRTGEPHPMRQRNGDSVGERLAQTPLYDPWLDLAVETDDGDVAAYSLYWFDPATKVGLVEPVRVEDDHQRRGLATTMITHGLDRLAARGAERIKIGFGSEAAGAVYQGLGFVPTSSDTWFQRP